MKQDLILVIGASGTVGSELVKLLNADGHRVRATTSQPSSNADQTTNQRTDKVHVNLATGEGLSASFEDVDRAFLLSPPGYADQYAMLSPLIQEAKRRGLKKVVLMTAMGANAVETSPFRRAEIELEKSGLNFTILRPNWFLQNFNTFWVHGIQSQSKILLPAGQAKVSFIDARDIAAVAARVLVDARFDNQALDLTGPEAVDHTRVAKAISDVTGKKVSYEEIAPENLQKGLLAAGLPADYVQFLLMIFGFLREGYNARVTDSVGKVLGQAPRELADYAETYKKAWQ